MTLVSEQRIRADFALIEAAAVAGERCPINQPFGPISSYSIAQLIAGGSIRTEVYSKNWRVVTIMDGPHKGKETAPCPWGGAPYAVNGRRRAV